MPVNLPMPLAEELMPISGLKLGFAQSHIRKPNRKDLLVIALSDQASVAGVFTLNRFCAAPVQVCREHLNAQHQIRALVINTGCANAGTGDEGLKNARHTCEAVASQLGIKPYQVLPFSTGVILEQLPMDRLLAGIPQAIDNLTENNWLNAAYAIMTTDTQPKAASLSIQLSGQTVRLTGISKGAGMIKPNMATMLGFLAIEANIAQPVLQQLVYDAANQSFNRITIDGDTSTNDSFVLIASGTGPCISTTEDANYAHLRDAVIKLSQTLAQMIVRDGEGATKFITINVSQARNDAEAAQIAYAIAHSPLIKTAFFASDPNLGRILAAIGYAGVSDLDADNIQLYLDDVWVAKNGGRNPDYQESDGQRVMKQSEISINVHLGRGNAQTTVWTCDLSHEYVSINADYRS